MLIEVNERGKTFVPREQGLINVISLCRDIYQKCNDDYQPATETLNLGRDDNGKLIPLSKQFNLDTNYSNRTFLSEIGVITTTKIDGKDYIKWDEKPPSIDLATRIYQHNTERKTASTERTKLKKDKKESLNGIKIPVEEKPILDTTNVKPQEPVAVDNIVENKPAAEIIRLLKIIINKMTEGGIRGDEMSATLSILVDNMAEINQRMKKIEKLAQTIPNDLQ